MTLEKKCRGRWKSHELPVDIQQLLAKEADVGDAVEEKKDEEYNFAWFLTWLFLYVLPWFLFSHSPFLPLRCSLHFMPVSVRLLVALIRHRRMLHEWNFMFEWTFASISIQIHSYKNYILYLWNVLQRSSGMQLTSYSSVPSNKNW